MPPRKKAAPKNQCKLHCCVLTDEDKARIKASLDGYKPGLWAEQNGYGPACHCGLPGAKEACPRHGYQEAIREADDDPGAPG